MEYRYAEERRLRLLSAFASSPPTLCGVPACPPCLTYSMHLSTESLTVDFVTSIARQSVGMGGLFIGNREGELE